MTHLNRSCGFALIAIFVAGPWLFADGPADNQVDAVRTIPPPGIELSDEQEQELLARCQEIETQWQLVLNDARQQAQPKQGKPSPSANQHLRQLEGLSSEVLVFPRAARMALQFKQFYRPNDFANAVSLLEEAARRIEVARESADWRDVVGIQAGQAHQRIIGGFRSKLDGSYQPYVVVLPPGFSRSDQRRRRLDLWFHGRAEKVSELHFLQTGRSSSGQFTPADTFVLHPFGRYSNAFKFAGEVDVWESLEYLQRRLPVDSSRIAVRGFSMGGAGCWQFATHYADRFFAANPGAGFSETPEFLKSFQGEDLSATPSYQRTLWGLYDCPPWARNLIHCPTVAYSGEVDRQKQAADVMQQALQQHDIELLHVIGPNTAHKIHADSKIEIEKRLAQLAAQVSPVVPHRIDFTTLTLRYHRMHWVDVRGLEQHWKPAHVDAELIEQESAATIKLTTRNVTRVQLNFLPGQWAGAFPCRPEIVIDGSNLTGQPVRSDRSWQVQLVKTENGWRFVTKEDSESSTMRKRPGLQGPIDDAFMDSFLFVLPSGKTSNAAKQEWFDNEAQHAQQHWQQHFRGDVRRVLDTELTPEQIARHHLILFGDPASNRVISRIADQLPVSTVGSHIRLGKDRFASDDHVVAMIYPNPLNPNRYVVLNSGFTFREYDYLNNARQTPKLPDWAVISIHHGRNARQPGDVVAAGFFDESWK